MGARLRNNQVPVAETGSENCKTCRLDSIGFSFTAIYQRNPERFMKLKYSTRVDPKAMNCTQLLEGFSG